MATGGLDGVVRCLRSATRPPDGGTVSDGELLEHFVGRRDGAAFETLVERHGPLVLSVCRRLLRDGHDVDDAFQATFLVLVRKAGSIRRRESVASWLHRTAFRAALEVQQLRQRSRGKPMDAVPEPAVPASRESGGELRRILDEELDRLPDKYREAVVLCDLQGKTRQAAAAEIGVPAGTVSGRLTTAHRMLARRLTRRGVTIGGAGIAAALSEGIASARVPRVLFEAAIGLASNSGVPESTAAITQGVLKSMLLRNLRIACALIVIVAAAAWGVGHFGPQRGIAKPPTEAQGEKQVFGVFVGNSPCDDAVRPLLQIPAKFEAHMIQWKLTLHHDSKTKAPAGYELSCKYGLTVPNQPGLDESAKTVERHGKWTVAKGTKSNPDGPVYDLDGAVSLARIDANVLHILNRDRSFMIGGGGWSYTLYRADAAEKSVDPALYAGRRSESYTLPPLPTGPTVFGIFNGRSPAQAIAREMKISGAESHPRVKWRVTLLQNRDTRAPTTYRIDHSLRPKEPREGTWSIIRDDPKAIVYRLDGPKDVPPLFLLQGDDNVLFFLDHDHKPLVGNADFSYTLNRKMTPPASATKAPEE